MDGYYQNNKSVFLNYLKEWVDQVVTEKLWEKYVDLHIDEIDKHFKDKKNWIGGSLFLFNCILSVIDEVNYDVILTIPLVCKQKTSLMIFSLESLDEELDITPPSFYLFPKGEKNFEKTIESAKFICRIDEDVKCNVYYKEENQNNEFYRTLYLRSS